MKKFWNWIRDETNPDARILRLEGAIAEESWFDDEVTPAAFKAELASGSGPITVWINSPGGDCVAAAQIYNMLMDYPADVTVRIDGIAASAASVIAMAGTKVQMSPVSVMMIHNPLTVAMGEQNIFRQLAHVITTTSGERKIPVVASHGTAAWIDEEGSYPESDDAFGQVSIGSYKLATMIKVSEELLNDSAYAVEWRGFNYGCVRTRVKDRPWTHWYKLPFIDYSAGVVTPSDEQPEEPRPVNTTVVIVSGGGKVNVRTGNGTSFGRITAVAPGTTYEYVATAANGWNAVVIGSRVGWVSGKYSRII